MHLAAPSRRALGLAAVSAIAMSTTVFALGGVAQAAPAGLVEVPDPWSFTYEYDGATDTVSVPAGYCGIDWTLIGAAGGAGSSEPGLNGGELQIRTDVAEGDTFLLAPGGSGADHSDGGAGGSNAYDDGAGGNVNGEASVGSVGGGGGAGTVVEGESLWLAAYGGDGGDDGSGEYYGYGYGYGQNEFEGTPDVDVPATTGGNGSIAGVGVPCPPEVPAPAPAAPLAPSALTVEGGNGTLTARFTPEWNDAPNSTDADSWEYQLGNGAWTPVQTTQVEYSADRTFTLAGLTNGSTYSLKVRGVSAAGGAGAATAAVTATPYAPVGAPGNVAVTTTATSVRVTWTAPAVQGTFPVAGYVVGMGAGEMGGEVCETAADVLSCNVTGVQSGVDYSVVVFAVDSMGNSGEASDFVMTGAIPFPAGVPASNGPLATSGVTTSAVTPGQTITVSGTGYAPFSTVTVLVYSSPTVLGTAQADANGAFTFTGKLPAGLAAGSHTLVAAGVDADGNPRYLTQAITVAGGATGATGTSSGGLAYTGADIAVPAIGGLAALALGGGLVLAGRRKRADG